MNINPFEKIKFTFEAKGELTGTIYQGVFQVKPALNLMEYISLNNEQRDLLNHPKENETIDIGAFNAAMLLAQLKTHVVTAPGWFTESENLKNCYDFNIPLLLNQRIQEESKKWRDKISSEADKAKNNLEKA